MIDEMLRTLNEFEMPSIQNTVLRSCLMSARTSERELMGRVEALEKKENNTMSAQSQGLYRSVKTAHNLLYILEGKLKTLESIVLKEWKESHLKPTPSECKHRYNQALSGCCLDCGYNPNPCPDSLWMQHSDDCRCKACSIIKKVLNDKPNPSECEHTSGGLGACPKCGTPYKDIEVKAPSTEMDKEIKALKCPQCREPYAKCGCSLGAEVKAQSVEDEIVINEEQLAKCMRVYSGWDWGESDCIRISEAVAKDPKRYASIVRRSNPEMVMIPRDVAKRIVDGWEIFKGVDREDIDAIRTAPKGDK